MERALFEHAPALLDVLLQAARQPPALPCEPPRARLFRTVLGCLTLALRTLGRTLWTRPAGAAAEAGGPGSQLAAGGGGADDDDDGDDDDVDGAGDGEGSDGERGLRRRRRGWEWGPGGPGGGSQAALRCWTTARDLADLAMGAWQGVHDDSSHAVRPQAFKLRCLRRPLRLLPQRG